MKTGATAAAAAAAPPEPPDRSEQKKKAQKGTADPGANPNNATVCDAITTADDQDADGADNSDHVPLTPRGAAEVARKSRVQSTRVDELLARMGGGAAGAAGSKPAEARKGTRASPSCSGCCNMLPTACKRALGKICYITCFPCVCAAMIYQAILWERADDEFFHPK